MAKDPERDDAANRDNPKLRDDPGGNVPKDVDEWVTGDEPATSAQLSYLHTLAEEAGEEVPSDLSKAQASEHIERLQEKTGRGREG